MSEYNKLVKAVTNRLAIITGGAALGVALVGPILGAIGFGASGVVAGSVAAAIQSGIGSVAAGSLFASAQSAAMAGVAASTALPVAGIAIAVTIVVLLILYETGALGWAWRKVQAGVRWFSSGVQNRFGGGDHPGFFAL